MVENRVSDKSPEGIRNLNIRRADLLRHADALAVQLAAEHPEIVELYVQTGDSSLTLSQIAERVVPDVAAKFPNTAQLAVRNVLHQLMTPEERAQATAQKRGDTLRRNNEAMGDEEKRAQRQAAARARFIKHGSTSDAMIRGRGLTPWSEEERKEAVDLAHRAEFQRQLGSSIVPDYVKIAAYLNSSYHAGNPTRNKNAVKRIFKNREA